MTWLHDHVHFEPPALAATLADCVQEVHHAGERIARLEKAIDHAVPKLRNKFVLSLTRCRCCVRAQMTAVTMVPETGSLSRFPTPRQLMSYSELVSSEYSSGNCIQRGGITKTGNAHLRRVLVEAAWAYQHKPWVGGFLLKLRTDFCRFWKQPR